MFLNIGSNKLKNRRKELTLLELDGYTVVLKHSQDATQVLEEDDGIDGI